MGGSEKTLESRLEGSEGVSCRLGNAGQETTLGAAREQ